MDSERYIPRFIDDELKADMKLFGAVLITGPKWCGKTTSAKRVSNSTISLQNKVEFDRYRSIASMDPSILLDGDKPLLIDEWQKIPEIWDAVRFNIDECDGKGVFILTGSNAPNLECSAHPGVGRISKLKMRTMSLFESGDSNGTVSLGSLFENDVCPSSLAPASLENVASVLVRGGWPGIIGLSDKEAHRMVMKQCESILDSEIKMFDGKSRDAKKMRAVMRSLSRHTSTQAAASTILADIVSNERVQMSDKTLYDYLSALERLCYTEDLDAWSPRLRSKSAIRTSSTRHMTDPSIAAYFIEAGPKDLLHDPETFGLLFESMVIRDLRIYAQALDGNVSHYRDGDGLEVDAIVHLWGGRWGAIEVKLTDSWADEAAHNLLKLKKKIDMEHMNPPSFLAVITATGAAYTRPDGIHVIPITCLRE